MAGLSLEGFSILTLTEIRDSMSLAAREAFGPSVDVSDGSILGQLIGIMAERVSEVWELAEAVNSSMDPDGATGAQLDAIAALTGTLREPASYSTTTLTLTGTPATVVPAGSTAAVIVTEEEFATDASATIVVLTSWVASTAYAIGNRRTNAGKAYICTTAGTSAAAVGPITTAEAIVDGAAVWRYLGSGTGAVDVAATAVVTGATVATSGSVTEIVTPVGGWENVINLLDADEGSDIETDESLRIQREIDLAAPGTAPVDAIRSALLDVDGVTAVTVFHNPTDVTDADGVPPHAVEALVQGGADQDVIDALFAAVAAGIATHGTETGVAVDASGIDQPVEFSRPDEIEVYVTVTLVKDPDVYPTDGDAQVAAAIVAWGDAQPTGKNVVASAIGAQAFAVDGVLDVTLTRIGTAPAPGSSVTISVSLRQLALYDTSRVVVVTSNGVP